MKYLTILSSTHRFCMWMKSQTVGLQVQMQKLQQLSQCGPIHTGQNGETRILHPMIIIAGFKYNGTNVRTGKMKIRKQEDSIETFGKFVAAELCDILIASREYVFRRARRKVQEVLMDAGDAVDLTSSKSSWPITQLYRHIGFKPPGWG